MITFSSNKNVKIMQQWETTRLGKMKMKDDINFSGGCMKAVLSCTADQNVNCYTLPKNLDNCY